MSHAPGMVSRMSPVDVCPPSCLPVPPWQAYLSLPEGAASAVGLIAMMTDHYARAVSRAAEAIAGQPLLHPTAAAAAAAAVFRPGTAK